MAPGHSGRSLVEDVARTAKRPTFGAAGAPTLMKICFWVTSFQADNQALASYLSQQPGVEVLVAMDRPELYAEEPISALLPFRGRWLDRQAKQTPQAILAFAPDCLIVDNHLPKQRLARHLYVLWHGYGWRVDDLSTMRRELNKLVGRVDRPNPYFRWHAFGEWDHAYRREHSGFAAENVVAHGSPYSDLIRPGSPSAVRFDAARVQPHYSIDLKRPTVLLGLTWHHGGALGHWGDDDELHEALATQLGRAGANLLIRMHDRHRYQPAEVRRMEALAARHPHVQLKFKSSAPDSLVDLLLCCVMISNYSSFLNAFYHTGKPSIHIDPIAKAGAPNYRRDLRWGRLRTRKLEDPLASWKLPPSDVGGLIAHDFAELSSLLARCLADAGCCRELAEDFNRRHIAASDGHSCERVTTYLQRWIST
jgi:hypothetical protein